MWSCCDNSLIYICMCVCAPKLKCWVWWYTPFIHNTQKAEVGGSLWIQSQHSELKSNQENRPCLKQRTLTKLMSLEKALNSLRNKVITVQHCAARYGTKMQRQNPFYYPSAGSGFLLLYSSNPAKALRLGLSPHLISDNIYGMTLAMSLHSSVIPEPTFPLFKEI